MTPDSTRPRAATGDVHTAEHPTALVGPRRHDRAGAVDDGAPRSSRRAADRAPDPRRRLDAVRELLIGIRHVSGDLRAEIAEVVAEAASGGIPDRTRVDALLRRLETGFTRLVALAVDLDDIGSSVDVQQPDGRRRPHVLVVDGSLGVRRLVGDRLAAAGFDVTTAADGLVAHQCLASRPCAAIVTDLRSPHLDAHALVEACAHRLPIVVTTDAPPADDEVRALASGAVACLAKDPSIADRVLDVLLEHLPSPAPSP